MHILFKAFSHNQEITVYDTSEFYGEKGNFRILQFANEDIQGALDLNHPERILFEYPRAIIHLMEFNHPSFEKAFVIGHGIGTIPAHFSEKNFKVVELDDKIVELSRRYFGYRKDNVIVGDGRGILEGEKQQTYDYIILDAFTDQGTPRHLTTREFFGIARDKLDSQGSIILNLIGRGENDKLINAIHYTLREAFAYSRSFSLPSAGAACMQNILIVGRHKPIRFQEAKMAGFTEIELRQGHMIMDNDR